MRITRADPPAHRPERVLIPAGAALAPVATIGTRNLPVVVREEKGKAVAELRLADLPNPRATPANAAVPLPRPVPKAAAKAAAAGLGPVPDLVPDRVSNLRPAHRPGATLMVMAIRPEGASWSRRRPRSRRPSSRWRRCRLRRRSDRCHP